MSSSNAQSEIEFAESAPLTVGIEEEFLLLDGVDAATTDVALRAASFLDGEYQVVAVPGGWLKPELLQCSIELATAPSAELLQVDVDLRALREELVRRAGANDCRVVALGLHPDLQVTRDIVWQNEERQEGALLYERVGDLVDQATHGIHVHVGVPDLESAVHVAQAIAAQVPMLIALTANSPLYRGGRAPFQSMRSEVMRTTLWGGPTPDLRSMAEYREAFLLHQGNNADGPQRYKWDAAPVHELGTVELRMVDSCARPEVALGVAAFCQATAARALDLGAPQRMNASLELHNRWSAMEFGSSARFLVPGRAHPVDLVDVMGEAMAAIGPYADELGTGEWLAVFDDLLAENPAQRALRAFEAGGLPALLAESTLRGDATDHADA